MNVRFAFVSSIQLCSDQYTGPGYETGNRGIDVRSMAGIRNLSLLQSAQTVSEIQTVTYPIGTEGCSHVMEF